MGNGDKVIGYVRVSTEEQGSSGAGLDAQRVAIQAECERRGWALVRVEEDVLSAPTTNRPGLRGALESCRSGEVDGVVAAKLDRLSRSIVDFGNLLEEARRRGFNVVALGLDLSTPQGELVGNVIASVAQWKRRIIGQRTKEAFAVKKLRVEIGRPATLPAAVVRRIRRQRGRGESLAAISAGLTATPCRRATAGKPGTRQPCEQSFAAPPSDARRRAAQPR